MLWPGVPPVGSRACPGGSLVTPGGCRLEPLPAPAPPSAGIPEAPWVPSLLGFVPLPPCPPFWTPSSSLHLTSVSWASQCPGPFLLPLRSRKGHRRGISAEPSHTPPSHSSPPALSAAPPASRASESLCPRRGTSSSRRPLGSPPSSHLWCVL